ncbi:VWA domain-containing protein [Paralimibaculum aggregatum]|uniref:VWA domain-containing protein n=1 Tax=Paralimibaculum aggregatum TaxID=3036245 RepID=A0ABQ6LKM2_9RHOB|nr:VWA domain-containing protein [Limibaculum sp. NKW23]GMG82790.1 VWA domain-containing protein [Limibaculum sp. NKW23]
MSVAPLPRALRPLTGFAAVLRAHGFAVAPEQTEGFVAAVGLLGPTHVEDLRRAGHALLAPPPERHAEFDALFDTHFLGRIVAAQATAEEDDEAMELREDQPGTVDLPEPDELRETGAEATTAETLSARSFAPLGEDALLRRFAREARTRLPQRIGRRRRPVRRGRLLDMRRALRQAVRHDGEVVALPRRARRPVQRRVCLLIDISGSMKAGTESALRLAHALVQAGDRVEVFTLGTRLTRLTRALRLKNREAALARAGTLAADWDGGTRLGDALGAFLAVPRFASFARGAAVVVLSDGLERGGPEAMIAAVARLSRLAWRLDWLTPLAADPNFVPRTAALSGALPHIDRLGDGSSIGAIAARLLSLGRTD